MRAVSENRAGVGDGVRCRVLCPPKGWRMEEGNEEEKKRDFLFLKSSSFPSLARVAAKTTRGGAGQFACPLSTGEAEA